MSTTFNSIKQNLIGSGFDPNHFYHKYLRDLCFLDCGLSQLSPEIIAEFENKLNAEYEGNSIVIKYGLVKTLKSGNDLYYILTQNNDNSVYAGSTFWLYETSTKFFAKLYYYTTISGGEFMFSKRACDIIKKYGLDYLLPPYITLFDGLALCGVFFSNNDTVTAEYTNNLAKPESIICMCNILNGSMFCVIMHANKKKVKILIDKEIINIESDSDIEIKNKKKTNILIDNKKISLGFDVDGAEISGLWASDFSLEFKNNIPVVNYTTEMHDCKITLN